MIDCGCTENLDHAADCDRNHWPHDACEPACAELRLRVGIGGDGPYDAVVALPTGPLPVGAMRITDIRGIPRWNGWIAEPTFDRTTVDRIAAMLDRDRAAGLESDRIVWRADGSTLTLDRPSEPDWPGEIIAPNAAGRYAIGAFSWCWYEWDAEEDR